MHIPLLSCDYGEAVTPAECARDWELLKYVAMLHVACGGHAGDEESMLAALALHHTCGGLAIGAHPSYADRAHFGRRSLEVPLPQLQRDLSAQIGHFKRLAQELHTAVNHIKPHGALYHAAAEDRQIADTVIRAVREHDANIPIVGPPRSELLLAAIAADLPILIEGFVDRQYEPDGSLTPRSQPGALITDPQLAAEQARRIAFQHEVVTSTGQTIPLQVDLLTLHSDHEHAVAIAAAVRAVLDSPTGSRG